MKEASVGRFTRITRKTDDNENEGEWDITLKGYIPGF